MGSMEVEQLPSNAWINFSAVFLSAKAMKPGLISVIMEL